MFLRAVQEDTGPRVVVPYSVCLCMLSMGGSVSKNVVVVCEYRSLKVVAEGYVCVNGCECVSKCCR